MKKLMTIGAIFGMIITSKAQQWDLNGTDIQNNNSGRVIIRRDGNTLSSIPSYGSWGLFAYSSSSHPSGTASKVLGAYLLSLNNGTGNLNESVGAWTVAGNGSGNGGTITKSIGLLSKVQSGTGTVLNGYGIYIDVVQANNDYGLYQSGADDDNFFAGKVGIGTTNITSALTVNGKIEAEEIEVKDVGADFVFEPDYQLRSLQEVKNFISENKHLPDIPPASETEKGVELGAFNEKLLQKIEELTLYVIQQNEEMESMKIQIRNLEDQLEQVK